MRPTSALREYQDVGANVMANAGQLAVLLAPGYGKTIMTETALCRLGSWPALVVAPAQVVEADVWGREARAWEHTQNLQVVSLEGSERARRRALWDGVLDVPHIEVVSYENLLWLTDEVDVHERYRAIVFDELSKMKHPGTKRFRRLRGKASRIPVRFGLTGTPVGNHLLDLWGEMFMVAGEKALGSSVTGFRLRYFEPIDYFQRVWRLRCCPDCKLDEGCRADYTDRCGCHRRAMEDIRKRIKPYVYVLPPQPSVRIPEVRVNPIRLALPPEVERISHDLMTKLWARLPSGTELETLSASAVAGKLRQLASGAVYLGRTPGAEGSPGLGAMLPCSEAPGPDGSNGFADPAEWEEVHAVKLAALENLLDELQGEPVMIFYWFRHDATRIKRILAGRRWADLATGGRAAIDAWNAGKLEVLLLHPQSAGFGINLQGAGHHVVWFSLPWSHELWTQGNGRSARPGQKAPWVTAHMLLCGPADAMVELALQRKGRVERELMEALT